LAVFAVFVIDAAYLVHLAPALVDKGFAPLAAAKLVGVSGVAAIAGKLVAGWLFDRMPFEAVSTSVMIMLAVACALFVPFGGSTAGAVAVCVALGLTIGAMFTVIACVTRQLFAADAFGLVFGVLTSVMALASAAGPMLGSTVHDRFGSYDGIYWAGVVVAGVSALLLATLKPRGAAAAEAAAGAK
jgi:predicted MFS family arabinose efflux permease